jgi:WD40 repeat protein
VTSLLFTPDGKTLISGGADPAIRFWDVASHEQAAVPWRDHAQAVWGLQLFQPNDEPVLVSLGGDGTVLWQDLKTGAMLGPGLRTGKESEGFAIDPEGPSFYFGTTDNTAQVWRMPFLDWQTWVCAVANRNLTPEEWRQYLHNDNYQKTCPDLP